MKIKINKNREEVILRFMFQELRLDRFDALGNQYTPYHMGVDFSARGIFLTRPVRLQVLVPTEYLGVHQHCPQSLEGDTELATYFWLQNGGETDTRQQSLEWEPFLLFLQLVNQFRENIVRGGTGRALTETSNFFFIYLFYFPLGQIRLELHRDRSIQAGWKSLSVFQS